MYADSISCKIRPAKIFAIVEKFIGNEYFSKSRIRLASLYHKNIDVRPIARIKLIYRDQGREQLRRNWLHIEVTHVAVA